MNPFFAPAGRLGSIVGTTPYIFFDDFNVGGKTGADLALANESDPHAYFGDGADFGVWFVSHATLDAVTQYPAVQDDADCGTITMTTDATDGEHISMQVNGESFLMAAGRRMYFETRLSVSAVAGNGLFGISVNSTDPWEDAPSDFVGFSLSGDADIEASCGTGTGAGTLAAATGITRTDTGSDIAASTFVVLAWLWDGVDSITYWVDGVKKAKNTTNLPIGKYMSPILCIESNGAATALTVDYIYVSNVRP